MRLTVHPAADENGAMGRWGRTLHKGVGMEGGGAEAAMCSFFPPHMYMYKVCLLQLCLLYTSTELFKSLHVCVYARKVSYDESNPPRNAF